MESSEANPSPENLEYQAPYIEISEDEALNIRTTEEMHVLLRRFVPADFNLGEGDNQGDLLFRTINLPKDPTERKERVEEITNAGTDRTDFNHKGTWTSIYESVAKEAGVNSEDITDCHPDIVFYGSLERSDLLDELSKYGNALMVYDGKTEHGLREIDFPEYVFRDIEHRNKALLGIIGIADKEAILKALESANS